MRFTYPLLMVLVSCALLGCDDKTGKGEDADDAQLLGRPTTRPGTAVITGSVKLTGWQRPVPPPKPQACGQHTHMIPDETVLVGPAGQLQNVVVFIKNSPRIDLPVGDPVVLDQIKCVYVPHVVALRAGQTLRVKSSDTTLHNVHIQGQRNPTINRGMNGVGEFTEVFRRQEFMTARCDIHPWMLAHVAVFDHPLFFVTGADGAFRIERIPAGNYTLVAWHEKFGEIEKQIELKDGATQEQTFTYEPPGN